MDIYPATTVPLSIKSDKFPTRKKLTYRPLFIDFQTKATGYSVNSTLKITKIAKIWLRCPSICVAKTRPKIWPVSFLHTFSEGQHRFFIIRLFNL